MRSEEPITVPRRYRVRRHEVQVDKLLRRLREFANWDPRHDLAGSQLRAQARAVDLAEQVATADPTPYAAQCLALTARELKDTLVAYGMAPGGAQAYDPFDAFIASLDTDAAKDHRPPP